jgi:hypothetical protein
MKRDVVIGSEELTESAAPKVPASITEEVKAQYEGFEKRS